MIFTDVLRTKIKSIKLTNDVKNDILVLANCLAFSAFKKYKRPRF
jgi:hypothetical protein